MWQFPGSTLDWKTCYLGGGFFLSPPDIQPKPFSYIVHYQHVIQCFYHAVESVVQITRNAKGNQALTTLIFCTLWRIIYRGEIYVAGYEAAAQTLVWVCHILWWGGMVGSLTLV